MLFFSFKTLGSETTVAGHRNIEKVLYSLKTIFLLFAQICRVHVFRVAVSIISVT